MTPIGREDIMKMIPHAGTMCLLDAVLHWDQSAVRCTSHRYRDPDNPLRRGDGTLGTACGIEIAAQAMAVHGRLLASAGAAPQKGFLVSLRDVRWTVPYLDSAGDLIIDTERLMGDANGASYRFSLASEGLTLLSGRAMVLLGISV